ncbi:MAG: FHA domain-containing protein [Bacteroidales bacterium]|nr:FHA domain-containing protein [Bacteroidales bacterium]
MDVEIKIGRDVEGANVCRVSPSYSKVSRLHAILHWHDGVAILEDRSSNGTYVNGIRITRTQVRENDLVYLGGNGTGESYLLDLRRLIAYCRDVDKKNRVGNQEEAFRPVAYPSGRDGSQRSASPQQSGGIGVPSHDAANAQRTDYSKEFERVKQAYIDYNKELSALTKKANLRMSLPRVLLSLIPTVLGLVVMLIATDMMVRIIAMSAGGVLSGLIGTLTMGRGSSKKEKLQEDMLDLKLKYQKEYRCPKCGKEFNLGLHWKELQAAGKCPYGCGAKF